MSSSDSPRWACKTLCDLGKLTSSYLPAATTHHTHTLDLLATLITSPVPPDMSTWRSLCLEHPSLTASSFWWALSSASWLSLNATASVKPFLTLLALFCQRTMSLFLGCMRISLSVSFSITRTGGLSKQKLWSRTSVFQAGSFLRAD